MHYLIIGGGVAGTTAAEELRKRDGRAEIVLVSEEFHPLYSRVLLPHYLKQKISRERVFLKKETWYADQQIEWITGITCTHLDPRSKCVSLSDGRELPYDKLLIATGGEVNTIDEDPRGVSYSRTLDDADHLMQLLSQHVGGHRVGVYGSGFMACEYLNIFAHYSLPTVLFHRAAHFFSRALLPEAGALIAKHVRDHGVELHPNTTLKCLKGNKQLEGLVTNIGKHASTILGIGIGIEPDFSWLTNTSMATHKGIVTNEFLETNIPDVYAAGDVVEFFDPIVGRHIQVGNWMNAMSQGRTVAKSMSGERTSFELVSSYATNALGLELIFVGDVEKSAADRVHVIGSVEEGGVTQIFERAGRVVGGAMLGRNQDRGPITKAIEERASVASLRLLSS
jgi:NAD(P)H-nitrite reductase large subunit